MASENPDGPDQARWDEIQVSMAAGPLNDPLAEWARESFEAYKAMEAMRRWGEFQAAEARRLASELEAERGRSRDLRALLAELQWSGPPADSSYEAESTCPECSQGDKGGHAEWCRIAKALEQEDAEE